MQNSIVSAAKILTAILTATLAPQVFGVAHYVYHERTGNDPGCGGVYVTALNPSPSQAYALRYKVEYQFFTDTTRVYYTTDGSAPSGSKGVASGTTQVADGAFVCTFGSPVVDVWEASIPAQPAGTVVKYIVGAWHSGGGDEIFANSGTCEGCGNFNNSSLATVFQYTVGSITDLYWDANGDTAGAGATPTGTWGTDNFWSTVFDGTSATAAWTAGRNAIFSAGNDANGTFTVTVSGAQTAGGMRVEEGFVTLASGGVNVGTGNVTVESGATLSTDSSLRIPATAGATLTLNGGTKRTTNPGNAGSFIDIDFTITLGPDGGTLTHITSNILNIVQGTTVISGPGSLTKAGIGVLAIASACTYGGSTIINDGEIRIRTSADRLPVTTPVVVNAAGILNLNGLSQRIGSLSGDGLVGLGAGTLTVGNASDTTFAGSIRNIANYGAGGVATGSGRVVKNGTGTLTLSGINSYTGSLTVNDGAVTVSSGATLCDPLADIVIQGGALNLDNAAQTILSLSGNGGALNLGTGHTLTVNPSNTRTNASTIAGEGALSKTGTGTLVLAGNNTYSGGTTVSAGTLRVQNAEGSATGTGPVLVGTGGTLRGPGSVAGAVTVNGTISPGASPGTQSTGPQTWNGGGSYVWEMNDVDAGAGADPGWDLIDITGGLTIAATPESKFSIKITSLTLANAAGDVHDFANASDYAWTILQTTTGISGFDAGAINLDTTGFSNPLGTGLFVVETANGGNDLVLRFVHAAAIAAGPVGGTAECGSTFNFSVTATGTEPLAYQWKHAGTNIPGANMATLSVTASAETAGDYVVEVSNAFGTATSGTATLAVEDTTAPSIVCAPNETVECGAAWAFTAPTASDACSGTNVTVTELSTATNTVAGGYAVTRTWEAEDEANLTATCSQTITVLDTTAPSITCPANIVAPTDAEQCTKSNVTYSASATDACPGDVTLVCDPASGSTFAAGPTTVTCTATDAAGNSTNCTFTVTILELEPPTITCLADAIVECGQPTDPASTGQATGTDNCGDPAVAHSDGAPTEVTADSMNGWALNVNGLPATGTAELVDGPGTPPLGTGSARLAVGSGGANLVQVRTAGYNGTSLSALTELTYRTFRVQESVAGGKMPYLMLNVDTNNNGTQDDVLFFEPEYQTPAFNPSLPDQGSPQTGVWQSWNALAGGWRSLNGHAGMTAGAGVKPLSTFIAAFPDAKLANLMVGTVRIGVGGITGTWDNFDGNVDAAVIGVNGVSSAYDFEATAGTACPTKSVIARTWTATDDAGNKRSCTQLITVRDTTGPMIACPSDITADNDPGLCTAVVNFTTTASDACGTVDVVCTPASGSAFALGTTVVNCTATDGCGQTASCSFNVTVLDAEDPAISCPANVVVGTDPGGCDAVVNFTVSATDNCPGTVTVGCTPPSGSTFALGTTSVACMATDAGGRTASCGFTVTVNDTEAPTITAPANVTVCADPGQSFASGVSLGTPTTMDNCAVASVGNDAPTQFPVGTTTVTWTVTDSSGGTATAAQTVTVNGNPQVTVNSGAICGDGSVTLTATTDAANPGYLWSPGGETTPSITVSPSSTTTYTCTVTDGNTGCIGSGSGTVRVRGYDDFANTGLITIHDNAAGEPYPSDIIVSGLTATVCRVTVSLNGLSHDFPDDIDMVLVGPNGEAVLLMSDVGNGFGLSGVNLTFDDFAAASLADAGQIVSGTFKPSNIGAKSDERPDVLPAPAPTIRYGTNLSVFNGINPNGAWQLYVFDDELVDAGQIAGGWSLSISTLDPIADVSVAQLDIPDPVAVGSNVTYSVIVSNAGPAAASNVLASDTPPAEATLVSFSASQGTCALVGGTIWCELGSIAPGEAATVSVVVSPTASGTLVNTASVQSDAVDFNTANNSSSASTTVLNPPVIVTGPQDQVVCADGTATFTVVAGGEPPLSYQWYFGIDPISGATSDTLTLMNLQPAASGGYAVVVQNAVGATSASANLTVNPLPTVTVNSPTICNGDSAILSASTDAVNPSYLWSPGGETTASITVSPTVTTTYAVLVTDGVTTCTNSASGTVTVNQLTTASSLTSATDVCPGASVTFSTTAGGTGPHSYVWRKDGMVVGDNSPSLTIASVTTADAGTYCVEVTGACNSVTNCANLTVAAPPTIASQPQDQIRPMGNSATFSVTASGVGPLTYQWQRFGVDIAGETAATLTIPNLTLAQNGEQYSVVVSNCAGTVSSAAATLTVTPIAGVSFDFDTPNQFTNMPYYMSFNDWINAQSGILPSIHFEVPTGGVGPAPGSGALDLINGNNQDNTVVFLPLTYDFSLDGKTLIASLMVKIKAPANNSRSTQLSFVTTTNLGVQDANPQGFMSVIMQSTAQPALTYQLRLQHRRTTGSIQEVTPASTTATLTAGNWYKLTAQFNNIKGTTPDTIAISASLQDMGPQGTTPGAVMLSYAGANVVNPDLVNASRLHLALRGFENTGVDFRDNIYVHTATGPVHFVTPPASQTVLHGRRAVFQALVDGDGPYTYQWNRNGAPIPGARSWKYITPPVNSSDNGAEYTVTVTGPTDTITSDPGVLTVAPDALDVVSVGSVDGGTVGVRFDQPPDRDSALNPSNYLIDGQPATGARIYVSSLGTQGPDGIYVLLTPSSTLTGPYTVTVQGVLDLSGNPIGGNNSANGRVEGLAGVDINPLVAQPTGENYSFAPAAFEVTGGGADIFGPADSFRYVYTQRTGDFDVAVQVPAMNLTRNPSKGGLEVRASLDPGSPQVLASPNPQPPARNLFEGTVRPTFSVATVGWGANNGLQSPYPNVWVRLRRAGNTFLRYSSTNGVNWRFDGQVVQAMPDTVYFGLASCAVANGNPHTVQFQNFGEFAGYPGAAIAIITQPESAVSVNAGGSANLSVVATVTGAPAAGELVYLWQRHAGGDVWVNVATAGQTNDVFNTGPLFATDNGAEFRVVLKAPGADDVISSTTTITVNDAAAPTITAAAIPVGANAQVLITYSEPMGASAVSAGNYTVTNAAGADMGVASVAFLGGDLRTVLLTTANPLVLGSYGLRVSDVQDLGGNTINPNPTLRSLVQAATAPAIGPVVVEFYGYLTNGGTSTGIQDLTNNTVASFAAPSVKFANDTPDFTTYSNVFGINPVAGNFPDTLNHYGVQMYSYFVPTSTGTYRFYVRGDDFVQFLMNTNAVNSTSPAGAVLLVNLAANAQAYTAANSVTLTLTGGQRYYMELRFKETTGGDGATVAVRTDTTVPGQGEVIPASLLAFPDAVAKPTPVVVELYTGQVTLNSALPNDLGAAFGNGGYPDLIASLNSPNVIAGIPNIIGYARYMGYNTNLAQVNATFDNYFGRIYGNFIPPSNGLYRFWVRSDDSSQLWMNTNAVNSTDPAGATLLGIINDFYNANYRLVAENIYLNGGQRYYLEGRWREGTGGDGMTVTFRAQNNTAIPPTTEVMPGSVLEFPANFDRVGAIDGSFSPLNPVVNAGQTITFQAVGLRGAPPYVLSWFKDGVQVAGNVVNFISQPLSASDNGAVFTMVASNLFSRVERSTTVTVVADNTAPMILSAVGSQYQDFVVITFDEAVDFLSGGAAANYQINNGVGVLSATVDPATRRRVTLRTTPQTPGTTYTVTVNNVRDLAGNAIAPNTLVAFTAWIGAGKGFYVEVFTNIPGTAVANLTADSKYINNWPDTSFYTNRLGAGWFGNDTGLNNYGVRVTGLFSPPTNGLYRFYIRGDDGTQLFMNTNGPSPAGRVLIARNDGANSSAWDNGAGGSASPILSLNADTLYFTEAFMKEGGGGDHLEVMLRAIDPTTLTPVGGLPGPSVNDIVTGDFFVALGNPDRAQLTVVQAPEAEITVAENDTVTLKAYAHAHSFEYSMATGYRWQIGDGIGGFANIPGALGPSYTFIAPPTDAEYRLVIGGPGSNAVYTTTVHSSPDTKAPFIVSASSLNGINIDVVFNEPVEQSSAEDPFSYNVNNDAQLILGIVRREDPRKVTLTMDSHVGSTFTITASGVADLAGNLDFSTFTGTVRSGFVALDVGNPAAAGSTFAAAADEFDVVAGGNDIWGTSDVGHLTMTPVTGDFDVHLRLGGLTRPDPIAKAGLMVRETLDANSRTLHTMGNPAQYQEVHPVNPGRLTGRDLGEAAVRRSTGSATDSWQVRPDSVGPPSLLGNSGFAPVGVPNAWLRLKREGNLFTAYHGYDGVNWRLYAQAPFSYGKTVFLGMGTTAHTASQAPGLVTVANYRDIYIPPPPVILVQPAPSTQTVPLHASVSYSVVASNPPPNKTALTYQWFHNGVAIPNATGDSLSIADAQPDDGGVYTLEVNNDGGTTTSVPVTLNVDSGLVANADAVTTIQNQALAINAADLLANDSAAAGDTASITAVSGVFPVTYTADFNSGLPAGATIFGSTTLQPTGGVDDSGMARLTDAAASQGGSVILNELSPNRRVTAFNASFKLRIGQGSGQPADGFSFNFGRDIPIAATTPAAAENGGGSGFSFCVDNYQFHPYPNGGVAFTSGMKIRYRNLDIAGVRIPTWNAMRFADVSISITPQGMLTVLVDGTNVFGNIMLPNYEPSTGRFGIYARTGGEFQSHAIDDLSITALLTIETTREPAINVDQERVLGSAAISGGILHLTDAINSVQGSFMTPTLNEEPLTALSADFKVRIGGGTARAADGLSLCIAPDLPNASFGEEGAGSYLIVSLDTWDNGTTDTAPSFDIKWGGTTDANIIATKSFQPSARYQREAGRATATPVLLDVNSQPVPLDTDVGSTPTFVPVTLNVNSAGLLNLTYKGVTVFEDLQVPGFYGATNVRVGLGGRTGGANDNHWVDDLNVTLTTASGPVTYSNDFSTTPPSPYGTVVLNGGVINYTPPANVCGSDTFYYLIGGQYGGLAIGRVDVTINEATPTPPTITSCPTNRTIAAGLNCMAALPDLTLEVGTLDNCCCPTVTQDPPPGTLLARGTYTVTFTVTDSAGLTAQCQATITVADLTAPVITLINSGPVTIECHSTTEIPGATALDDCDGDLTSAIVVGGMVDRTVPGAYTLTYNVSDSGGNPATQVERLVNVVDTTAPSITCPTNIVTTCAGDGGTVVTYTVLASDICDSNITAVCTPPSGSLFPSGVATVNCTATDASGNASSCSFTVTVNDNPAQLSIERTSTNTVVISWPQTCGTFVLQQNDDLANASGWAAAQEQPTLAEGRWTVTVTADAVTRFYRLRSSP